TSMPGGGFDATGSIYSGSNYRYPVYGVFGSGAFTATVGPYPSPFSTISTASAIGVLAGATLGTSPLTVATGPVWIYNAWRFLTFTLLPPAAAPAPPAPPAPPAVPASLS